MVYCQEVITNTLTIKDMSGKGLNSYPLQIGRAFIKGEIKTAPGISFNGTVLNSQSQVTVRYDDGSVRFAVISTVLPTISAYGSGLLNIFPYSSMPAKDETCNTDEIFKQFPDLDIKITLKGNGTVSTVSAKEMINKGYYQWISQGSIRCELLIVDHSATRGADFGLGGVKSFRPIFIFNYWRTIGTIQVRSTLENSNMDTLQDINYNVTITQGLNNPTTLYSQDNINHIFGSRWTKVFWFGSNIPEPKVNIDYNITYLAQTNMFPNYLQNHTMSEAHINYYYNAWLNKPKGIRGTGSWTKYQPTTGMRDDIGPMPAWKSSWLVIGDWRFREISLGNADLAGAWQAHFREVDSKLFFDREKNVSVVGKPISLNAHPNLWFPDNSGKYSGALNTPRLADDGWTLDGAHQPDPFSVAYMLTGDYYYLESLQLWAALSVMRIPYGQYGRGKDGYAGITEQIRGNAWILRSRGFAALLSPDGSPEKKYFEQILEDALAYWQGQRSITTSGGSQLTNHPNYIWAQQNTKIDWSPLRFWIKDTSTKQAAFWQESFLLIVFGMLRDMGFTQAEPLLKEYQKLLTEQIVAPDYDPRYMCIYYGYTMHANLTWYKTWNEFKVQNDLLQNSYSVAAINDFKNGAFVAMVATSAASFLTTYQNGPELWNYLKTNVFDKFDYSVDNRAFKIYPRSFASPIFPQTSVAPPKPSPKPSNVVNPPKTSTSSPVTPQKSNNGTVPIGSKRVLVSRSNEGTSLFVSNGLYLIVLIMSACIYFYNKY
ncbi:hypothetical protein ABK040_014572 [Willaertia magna]